MSENKFGKWTVLGETRNRAGKLLLKCVCECGTIRERISPWDLKNGKTKSCGCSYKGKSKQRHPLYSTWRNMLVRCSKKYSINYNHYGARGIRVCERWMVFENFVKDMGLRPFPGAQLDRINNDGNYDPSNCKWSTQKEQNNNTSRNRFIDIGGNIKTVSQWARISYVAKETIKCRLNAGWQAFEAVFTPSRHPWMRDAILRYWELKKASV